jgi:predicted nucleic acid-binding protein
MNRVLIDTNVMLDILLNRKEFFESSVAVLKLLVERKYRRFVAATTLTNMYYIVCKLSGKPDEALSAVNKTLEWCEVAPVNRKVLDEARFSMMSDFEDAVQAAAAKDFGIDTVITRDKSGCRASGLQVYSPEEFLATFVV